MVCMYVPQADSCYFKWALYTENQLWWQLYILKSTFIAKEKKNWGKDDLAYSNHPKTRQRSTGNIQNTDFYLFVFGMVPYKTNH